MPQIKVEAGVDDITFYVGAILDEYSKDVAEGMKEVAQKTAESTVKKLKGAGKSDWNKYPKAWTSTEQSTRLLTSYVVHLKKPYYRIGHLLEFGHAKVNGGRVDAITHISPIATEMTKEYTEEVEKVVRQ